MTANRLRASRESSSALELVLFLLAKMADFKIFFCLLLLALSEEIFSLPFAENNNKQAANGRIHMFIPKDTNLRQRRAEEQSGSSGGFQEFITTAIKDGISASSALDSPTMFIGGFSVMMQPMPNGTEFAGQLMQMAPNYMNLLPGIGRK